MNKEIKSRVWDEIDKKMYYAGECKLSIDLFGYIYDDESDEPTRSMNHRMKLLRGTGLKDKNGVEIYEGDIQKSVNFYRETRLEVVKWRKDCADFEILRFSGKPICEVIGNIYENPELLSN